MNLNSYIINKDDYKLLKTYSNENQISLNYVKTNGKPDSKYYYVFTDGSNKKYTAGYAVYFGSRDIMNTKQKHFYKKMDKKIATNNITELNAIKSCLHILLLNNMEKEYIKLVTDSEYSLKSLTEYYKTWIKNGWKTASKKPVKNKELIQDCLTLMQEFKHLKLIHTLSHQPEPSIKHSLEYYIWAGNKAVDYLAQQ